MEIRTGDEQFSNKALLTALILFVKVVKKHDIYHDLVATVIQQSPLFAGYGWVRVSYAIVKQKATYIRLFT